MNEKDKPTIFDFFPVGKEVDPIISDMDQKECYYCERALTKKEAKWIKSQMDHGDGNELFSDSLISYFWVAFSPGMHLDKDKYNAPKQHYSDGLEVFCPKCYNLAKHIFKNLYDKKLLKIPSPECDKILGSGLYHI